MTDDPHATIEPRKRWTRPRIVLLGVALAAVPTGLLIRAALDDGCGCALPPTLVPREVSQP